LTARIFGLTVNAEDRYRSGSAEAPIVLKPKRCECGAATSAKQLTQYEFCPTCVKMKRLVKMGEDREALKLAK
jgi:Zn finger protein HypA/HybF involved in hydrogenase expression